MLLVAAHELRTGSSGRMWLVRADYGLDSDAETKFHQLLIVDIERQLFDYMVSASRCCDTAKSGRPILLQASTNDHDWV